MPLPFNKNFDEINEKDIRSLIDHSVRENQNLEYKSEFWKHNDEGTREMLKDITSIANAYGGYIIVGINEDKDGLPIEITEVNNTEKERDRIISSCLANISPRLVGIKLKVISIDSKNILIIFVPRGIRSPYMITYKGLYQFWIRHDRQKSRMSVDEIRDTILRTENLFADIKEFVNERKREISEEIGEKSYYVIGAIPLSTGREEVVDILDHNIRDILKNPPEKRDNRFSFNYETDRRPHCTLHGIKVGIENHESVELFRNSYLEVRIPLSERGMILNDRIKKGEKDITIQKLHSFAIIGYSITFYRILRALKEYLGLEEPYVGFISLYNIKGVYLEEYPKEYHPSFAFALKPWNKQHLEIPLSRIPDLSNPSKVAKFFTDRIWQAFGWDYTPLWDEKEQKFKWENEYI